SRALVQEVRIQSLQLRVCEQPVPSGRAHPRPAENRARLKLRGVTAEEKSRALRGGVWVTRCDGRPRLGRVYGSRSGHIPIISKRGEFVGRGELPCSSRTTPSAMAWINKQPRRPAPFAVSS